MAPPHGKAHSATYTSRKSAFCNLRLTQSRTLPPAPHGKAHSAISRSHRLRLSVTLRRPRGVGQPPARLRGTMKNGSTGQMRSSNHPPACGAACTRVRKSRFELGLTERRTLPDLRAPECAFPSRRDRRMRFSVTSLIQNALFRRMRLSSPGQTWRRLTERRTLQPAFHGKAHSTGAKTAPRQRQDRAKDVKILEFG